jgi:hypothetical protein
MCGWCLSKIDKVVEDKACWVGPPSHTARDRPGGCNDAILRMIRLIFLKKLKIVLLSFKNQNLFQEYL